MVASICFPVLHHIFRCGVFKGSLQGRDHWEYTSLKGSLSRIQAILGTGPPKGWTPDSETHTWPEALASGTYDFNCFLARACQPLGVHIPKELIAREVGNKACIGFGEGYELGRLGPLLGGS